MNEIRVVNPFVVVVATGEVGKVVDRIDDDESLVRFWDSPDDSFDRTLQNKEIEKFRPELNGLVWVCEAIDTGVREDAVSQFSRGTWMLERDSGHWGIKIRRSGSVPESVLIEPEKILIHRRGANFNPVGALAQRLSMSSKYFATRIRLLEQLYDQIQVSRGFRAIMSSTVRPFLHQINTMVRVLSDPTPRFILADEVGLGKTIEAGLIIRQILLDRPKSRIVIFVPKFLINQWRDELTEKLILEEYIHNGAIELTAFDEVPKLQKCDLLIVDEAHQLTQTSMSEMYLQISSNLPSTSGLLLLTATPMRGNRTDFLRLLHLVDPKSYSSDEFKQFEQRLILREESARDIEYLKIKELPIVSLHECFQRIRSVFPLDKFCADELSKIEKIIDSGKSAVEEREKLSAYLRESYRISRRVIRNRRADVLENGFRVTGRELSGDKPCEIHEELRIEMDSLISLLLRGLFELSRVSQIEKTEINDFITSLVESGLSSPEVFLDELRQSQFLKMKSFLRSDIVSEVDKIQNEIQLYGRSSRWRKTIEICSKHVTYPKSGGVVVFARSTNVASDLAKDLIDLHGIHNVSLHISTMSSLEQDEAVDHFLRNDGCRILIMDRSGEEGRNLQGASEIVHFSLPLSPNQLEQRLGRSDRFSELLHHRASSTVFIESDSALIFGQFRFLNEGLDIFKRSVATAQHLLSVEFENLLNKLIYFGLDALTMDLEDLAKRLETEIETIAYIDQIESISVSQEFSSSDFQKLVDLDEESGIEESAFGFYVDDKMRDPPTAPIGLMANVSKYSRQNLTPTMRLSLGLNDWRPAELRDLSNSEKAELKVLVSQDREYAFSRLVARSLPGTVLYRVGDPLVDWTIKFLETNELGRTWAVWRQIPKVPTTAIFSAVIRLGLRYDTIPNLSDWGKINLGRRMEMAMPSQMFSLLTVGKKILNHNEYEVSRNIPKLGMSEHNISGKNWRRVFKLLPDFNLEVKRSADLMISFAKKSVKASDDFALRRSQEVKTHEYVMSVLEINVARSELESRGLSSNWMNEEVKIHNTVMSSLDNPPCEVYSFGLILMSQEKL